MLTQHERELVRSAQVAQCYEGKAFKSPTIQAILRELSEEELKELRTCSTFAEIMEKVGAIKSRRGGGQ